MREIKFRALNEATGKLTEPFELGSVHCETYGGSKIVVQYTGLKDKNGREIYEGDVVDKQYHHSDVIDGRGEVCIGEGCDSDGYRHGAWLGWMAGKSSLLDAHEQCMVIGNVYENPDLRGK